MVTANFLTAGNAIFTVAPSPAFIAAQAAVGVEFHAHYTFRIEKVEMKATPKYPARTAYFVASLTGPDNTADYTYLGEFKPATGEIVMTFKSAFPETSTRVRVARRVVAAVVAGKGAAITAAGWEVTHCGYCGRCAKLLTVPESVACGFGPECVKQVMGCTLGQWAKQAKQVAAVQAVAAAVA